MKNSSFCLRSSILIVSSSNYMSIVLPMSLLNFQFITFYSKWTISVCVNVHAIFKYFIRIYLYIELLNLSCLLPISIDERMIAFQCLHKILMYNHSIDSYNLTHVKFYNIPSLLITIDKKFFVKCVQCFHGVTKVCPWRYQDGKKVQ